jgi:16S rRNA (uracil1498-N3)-methyltransferase
MSRVNRVFTEHSPTRVGEEIILPESESTHLARVLRIKEGDPVEVLDGKGGRFTAQCLQVSRFRVTVHINEVRQNTAQVPAIRMAIAMGKGNKWDDLIRPLTELGVSVLTPLLTERTEGSVSSSKLQDKKERWQKLAQEACKQSGNTWMPQFDDPIIFTEFVSGIAHKDDCWMTSLSPYTTSFAPKRNVDRISLFVGPEGGWSPQEEEIAKAAGINSFSLGPHVLRLETAAVSALAVARQDLLC